MLDQTLYPDNFNSAIDKIRRAIKFKENDFAQMEVLEIQVSELKGELDKLNEINSSLISEIKKYQDIRSSPEEVNALISQLRTTLNQRDQLVQNMLDSVLSEFENKPKSLSQTELQKVYEKIESDKLFYNVEKTIRDNIEFLKVTSLKPVDLGEVKEDQIRFYRLWKKLGPKIAEVYSASGNKLEDVEYIDNLFSQWQSQLDGEIWANIKSGFDNFNMPVESFNSSDKFVESLSTYIDSQIVKLDEIGHEASYEQFATFEKEIWQNELKSTWIPILRGNQILSEQQYEILESKMADWEVLYETEESNLLYFAGAAIVIVLLILAFILGGKMKERKFDKTSSTST